MNEINQCVTGIAEPTMNQVAYEYVHNALYFCEEE